MRLSSPQRMSIQTLSWGSGRPFVITATLKHPALSLHHDDMRWAGWCICTDLWMLNAFRTSGVSTSLSKRFPLLIISVSYGFALKSYLKSILDGVLLNQSYQTWVVIISLFVFVAALRNVVQVWYSYSDVTMMMTLLIETTQIR